MIDMNDEELRARFDALRQHDARHQPAFLSMWHRAQSSARSRERKRVPVLRWAAAAVFVVVGASLLVLRTRGRSDAPQTPAMAIRLWQSPTAGLLRTSGSDLLDPPSLFSSVFDGVTAPALKNETD